MIELDALVVGAGVAGLYATYRLRALGLHVAGVEAGGGVGGTWYWNRYPGCRCDVPTVEYSYSFDEDLEQHWSFPESMSAQPEIERYLNHVADRFDLRKHFRFDTRVTAAAYDESRQRWRVETDRDDRFDVRWCVMATGSLSAPNFPAIPGGASFGGPVVHTGLWPAAGVEVRGRRVGVIGTGSSAVQAIPHLARDAAQLTVFQRTPNYAFPADVTPLDPAFEAHIKANYREIRRLQRQSRVGMSGYRVPAGDGAGGEDGREVGFGALANLLADEKLRAGVEGLFAAMVRQRVHDPAVAEALIPADYPLGCKRVIVEIGYFETFNRPNVELVDLRAGAITAITPAGVRTEVGEWDLDVLVFATGFDALTGPLTRIDVCGTGGRSLSEEWAAGPEAYLGLVAAGFPNLFVITGPGSPSVISNMVVSIEQHVELVADIIAHLVDNDLGAVDADPGAQAAWMDEVQAVAAGTPFTAPTCRSWYLGSNVDGKARTILPYVGGCERYRAACDEVVADGYRGFVLTPTSRAARGADHPGRGR